MNTRNTLPEDHCLSACQFVFGMNVDRQCEWDLPKVWNAGRAATLHNLFRSFTWNKIQNSRCLMKTIVYVRLFEGLNHKSKGKNKQTKNIFWNRPTKMSRQAALSRVIWSAMVRPVKPGTCLANSTTLMMHLVASSLNLSHRPRSNWIRWSELEF